MQSHAILYRTRPEKLWMLPEPFFERIQKKLAQRPAHPFMRRDVEANLFSSKYLIGKPVFHELLENNLLPPAIDFQRSGQRGRKLHDTVI